MIKQLPKQPEYAKKLFQKAKTDREILDVIVSILKNELDYEHDDFSFIEKNDILVIRDIIFVTWDRKHKNFLFMFSVTTNILGAVILLNCLHLNGVHNIRFKNNFYISELEKNKYDENKIYYGDEAQRKYNEELKKYYEQQIKKEYIHNYILNVNDDKNVTYH